MSDFIKLSSLTYAYPNAAQPALHDVSLNIHKGEFVLITGASGSGKSTLLRAFNGLVPHFTGGRISGGVRVAGLDPVRVGPAQMSRVVGMVFQDPESQFVVDQVEDEIAFALENAALPREEMHKRIDNVLRQLEITHLRDRAIKMLSGGEQQRVAIASALALHPRVLVLDEPTSQLDADSAEDVLNSVARLNRELGLTVVLSEHRLERVLPYVQRVVHLEGGVIVDDGRWTTDDGRRPSIVYRPSSQTAEPRLTVIHVTTGYGECMVLRDVNLRVNTGEIVALMGRNGAGKSTLLKAIVGLVTARQGKIEVNGCDVAGRDTADICRDVAYLPQNPNELLFADTVTDELNITRKNHGLRDFAPAERDALLSALDIARHAESYPRGLSVGERQRVALGAVAAAQPKLLLLDEPTRGLDAEAKHKLANVLRRFANDGDGVLLVTHDQRLVEECAHRVLMLQDGVLNVVGGR